MKISACIITLNEEENLPRALASLRDIADEIVVVDSGSTDATRKIAESAGARFIHHDWEGYVGQKNFALTQASHDWILSIDADEELDPALRAQIQQIKNSDQASLPAGYAFSRIVFYNGKWIRHGDWFPDILVRLFDRRKAWFAGGHVHERLETQGVTATINSGFLRHYTYKNKIDRENRIQRYAELWARSAHEQGRKAGPLTGPLHALVRLVRGLIVKGGILDGRAGIEIAMGNAKEVLLKYKKLRELNQTAREVARG
jgi:glycosyltransferase involved in cell wall biosynthesis